MPRDVKTEQEIGPYSVGVVPEPVTFQFLDSDGNPSEDMTGWTAKFVIERISGDGSEILGQGVSSFDDAVNAIAKYEWHADDFGSAGVFKAQMWVGDGTSRLASIKFWWNVVQVTTAPNV